MSFLELQQTATKMYGQYPTSLLIAFLMLWLGMGIALFLFIFSPVNTKSTLEKDASEIGLIAVESRGTQNPLPPSYFFEKASQEIIITGVSAYRTIDQHKALLEQLIDKGVRVYLLILAPDSPAISSLSQIENRDMGLEIKQTITAIKMSGFLTKPGFQIRFFQTLPPYTGIMIDGDITPTGANPRDNNGIIRIQPRTAFGSQHPGVVLTFNKIQNQTSAFKHFAADFREQWHQAAERTDLL